MTLNRKALTICIGAGLALAACTSKTEKMDSENNDFNYIVDHFADIEVLRYQVPGFEDLSLNQKKLVYFLTEAALYGRDILADQNGRYNLTIRQLIENVYTGFDGDRESADFKALEKYLKQIWFGNGIHHHYSQDKFQPEFSEAFLRERIAALPAEKQPADLDVLMDVIFNPATMPKRVNQAEGADLVLTSANNLYEGVTQKEVEDFYNKMKDPNDPTPISYGLNSKLVKRDGKIFEEPYKVGGLYSAAIEKIVENLDSAAVYAESDAQRKIINTLAKYYRTGDLRDFDEYSILWADDTKSQVDFVNGFIENYGDPMGMRGAWESIVNFKNLEASHRTEILSDSAQWFEDHAPIDPRFRKPVVKGVSAKVINSAILAGDAYPATPIGINLPNADWIRAAHGSKSVTIENITEAYAKASIGNGFNEEFVIDEPTRKLMEDYLYITDNLHTDLHECLGHGSGQLLPGVDPNAMKAHGSTLEETRADLFALYYLADPKLIELGLLDNPDAYQAEYYKYILNGMLTQLTRIEPGKDVEEAHMRNRKLIAEWAYEHGKPDNVIELVKRDGKTYVKINDYRKLRDLFGQLLGEIQRIKSEGDYEAGRNLVETYAVKVDPEIHREILERNSHLNIPPYRGFVNPRYEAVRNEAGAITDVKISYDENYVDQMLRYSRDYSPLTK